MSSRRLGYLVTAREADSAALWVIYVKSNLPDIVIYGTPFNTFNLGDTVTLISIVTVM